MSLSEQADALRQNQEWQQAQLMSEGLNAIYDAMTHASYPDDDEETETETEPCKLPSPS